MQKESQRVMETKNKIKEAFFYLYQNKKIDKITVKEITDFAKINRGTFYVYYQDIYDLQEKIENEFYDQIQDKVEYVLTALLSGEDFTHNMPTMEFYYKNKKYFQTFLCQNGMTPIILRVKNFAKSLLKEKLLYEGQKQDLQFEYVLEYVTSAQIGIITYWFQKDLEISAEELAKIIREANLNGPIPYLIQLKNK